MGVWRADGTARCAIFLVTICKKLKYAQTSTVPSETDTGIISPLKTYNVTKADAKPVLSDHHEISFDDKKVLIPWEEGKTSHL